MIRDTIDVYLSCIDKRKVHLVFQLWFISFFTVMADVAFTASGYEPWDPPTFMVAWLASLCDAGRAGHARRHLLQLLGRRERTATDGAAGIGPLGQGERAGAVDILPSAKWPSLNVLDVYWEDPDGFWGDLPDDGEAPHD